MFNKAENKTDLLLNLSNFLKSNKIKNFEEESKIIISYSGKEENYTDVKFDRIDNKIIELILKKRLQGKPLSKIIKQKGFWKNIFITTDDTLDPRADSEIIIENILKDLSTSNIDKFNFIDLCCGTGCLGISILYELQNSYCDFIDISEKAISVCKKNILKMQVQNLSNTFVSNLFSNYSTKKLHQANFLICNPPYIPSKDCLKLDNETLHDPRIALDGGQEGTFFYFEIVNFLLKIKFNGDIYF